MEDKKTFGEYITQKRKEAGLTQKSFADHLFVTESAVSKWERGLSYPDITLIRDICETLSISEHELLTASEDTQTRNYEKLAKKYIRLITGYKYIFYLLYGISLPICFICNIATEHTLSWFFIVLTAEMVGASLTLLPVLTNKKRGFYTLGGFTLSFILLLLMCNIYTNGDWFFVAAVSVVFGMTVLFLPIIVNHIWLPKILANQKTLLCFTVDTVLLVFLLFVCGLNERNGWFLNTALPITGFCMTLPWAMMLIIRYAKVNWSFKTASCLATAGVYYYYIDGVLNMILGTDFYKFGFQYNLLNWSAQNIDGNINAIFFFTLIGMAVLFAIAGIIITIRDSKAATINS